jgi:hypothetical protein
MAQSQFKNSANQQAVPEGISPFAFSPSSTSRRIVNAVSDPFIIGRAPASAGPNDDPCATDRTRVLLKRESLPPASPQDSFSMLVRVGQPSGQRRTGGLR